MNIRIYLNVLLIPLSWIYRIICALRSAGYRIGILPVKRLDVPVVCVGNLTTGGTGKTPAVIMIAKKIIDLKQQPAILLRGYKRNSKGTKIVSDGFKIVAAYRQAGDEALMLSQELPSVPIIVDHDRIRGGREMVKRFQPGLILLDDGFQHHGIHRDMNILMVDCLNPWGGGRLIPAGHLREPLNAVKRADVVVLTHGNLVSSAEIDDIKTIILRHNKSAHILTSEHMPVQLTGHGTSCAHKISFLREKKVTLLSAIGNTDSFTKTVALLGASIVKINSYPDHYVFTQRDLDDIVSFSEKHNSIIVTTAKDAVRIPQQIHPINMLYVLHIVLHITEGEHLLFDALRKFLQ
ncbi:MAG: tetraacyldisaccharide 4'-kinase [bacterium]